MAVTLLEASVRQASLQTTPTEVLTPNARTSTAPVFAEQRRVQLYVLLGLTAYLALTQVLFGVRAEHAVLAALFIGLTLVGGKALRFLTLFLPVVLTGATYDLFRAAIPLRGDVHVADIYHAEVSLFGISGEAPALWFVNHTHAAVDLVTGISYAVYLYIPMGVALALHWLDKQQMLRVGLAFLFANLIGLVLYLAYPAAPPWYVAEYGLGPVVLDAAPSAAGTARFDALIGVPYFTEFYKRSANVFGAMPSLHVAYPASTWLAMMGYEKRGRWTWPLGLFVLLVAFAAVYLQHHYIIDVLAGLTCAGLGVALARYVVRRRFGHLPTRGDSTAALGATHA